MALEGNCRFELIGDSYPQNENQAHLVLCELALFFARSASWQGVFVL